MTNRKKRSPEQHPTCFPKLDITGDRKHAFNDGAKHFIGKPCKLGHTRRDMKYGYCVTCKRDKTIKRNTTKSKMIEIDHLKESKDFFIDQYYHLD